MKTCNLTQSSLRNDPIIRRMHGFSFRVFEDEIEVQDVISPRSPDQNLISSTPWTRKRVKNMKKSNDTRNWCLDSSNFLKFQGRVLPSRRTRIERGNFGCDRPMNGCLAINGCDHVFVDQNGAIKSHLSDQ